MLRVGLHPDDEHPFEIGFDGETMHRLSASPMRAVLHDLIEAVGVKIESERGRDDGSAIYPAAERRAVAMGVIYDEEASLLRRCRAAVPMIAFVPGDDGRLNVVIDRDAWDAIVDAAAPFGAAAGDGGGKVAAPAAASANGRLMADVDSALRRINGAMHGDGDCECGDCSWLRPAYEAIKRVRAQICPTPDGGGDRGSLRR